MEDIRYVIKDESIELYLPTKNKGKFRWKTREDNSQFGSVFATKTIAFTDKAYIEWQIGYDSLVGNPKKRTILNELNFIGSNGKNKNPYELSEILYLMLQNKLLTKEEVAKLRKNIESREFSFDEEFSIQTNEKKAVSISDFIFNQHDIVLPTFSDYDFDQGLSIEISIQKQMYASGVQPMVYFAIPVKCFDNFEDIIGKTSKDVAEAKLVINNENKKFILNMFKYFGICSSRHKHDVLSILELFI